MNKVDRLPHVDVARDHNPVDRRADDRVLEIQLRLPQGRLVLADLRGGGLELGLDDLELGFGRGDGRGLGVLLGLGGLVLGDGGVVGDLGGILVHLRDQLLLPQLALAQEVAAAVNHGYLRLGRLGARRRQGGPGVLQVRAGLLHHGLLVEHLGARGVDLGLGLIDLGLEDVRVDASDDLPLLHLRVEVGVELPDVPRHLRADLHRDHGVERAGSRDGGDEGAAGDGGRPER